MQTPDEWGCDPLQEVRDIVAEALVAPKLKAQCQEWLGWPADRVAVRFVIKDDSGML